MTSSHERARAAAAAAAAAEIRSKYLRGWFAIDFLSVFPFELVGAAARSDTVARFDAIVLLRLLRLVKLLRLLRVSDSVTRLQARARRAPLSLARER